MIAGHELQNWLSSKSLQTRTMEQVARARVDLQRSPALEALDAGLAAAGADADAVLTVAHDFLVTNSAADALEPMIASARADPFFRPPLRNAATELVSGLWIYDRPALGIFLAVLSADALSAKRAGRQGRASVAFTGQRSIYRVWRAGGAVLSLWEVPEIGAGFASDSGGRCRRSSTRRLSDGDLFEIDGRRQGFVIEETASDFVYVQAHTPLGAAPLMAEYDVDTGEFVGASSTDEASSRIQMMLSLLRIMERDDAVPIFESLLEGSHFYARWQAMREFLGLDAERALPHLRRLSTADPHPEVRAAATATLAAIAEELRQPGEEPCHA